LTNTQISGIGVYNKNLFLELKDLLKDQISPVLKWSRIHYADVVQGHIHNKVLALPPLLLDKKILYHGTDFKLNTFSLGPKVVTIHDMQPFKAKWMDPTFAKNRRDLIRKVISSDVQRIITISEFTKNELIKYFPEAASKIDVVYLGHDFKRPSLPINLAENKIKKITNGRPFLFFIGNIEERKNLVNQIKAFEIIKERQKDLVFILSGKAGFNFKEVHDYISQSKNRDDIFLTGYLSDEEKKYAMENTACLMFVSWYEGFGIPLVDALSTNTNIVISRISVLEEIAKDYCYKCNPADPSDIACTVEIIMEKGNLKKVNLDSWKNEWSWKSCAEKTIEVYKKAYM
jgi:glycosyltransferase involved in cell wall biosynthesis